MTQIQSSLTSKNIFQSVPQDQEEKYANMSQEEFDSWLDMQVHSTNSFIKVCKSINPPPVIQAVQQQPGILTFFFNILFRN